MHRRTRVRQLVLLTAIVSLASVDGVRRLHAQTRSGPAFVPSQLIVKYRPGASPADNARGRGRAGALVADVLARTPAARAAGEMELVTLPRGLAMKAAIQALQSDAAVEYAEPNWIYTHAVTVPCTTCTSDPRFRDQWALNNTGQAIAGSGGGTADADIDAPEGWTQALGSAAVYVGVIDEGIDFKHEDLGVQPNGPIWTNPYEVVDGIDNDGNGYVDDIHGWDFDGNDNSVYDGAPGDTTTDAHGTHVAGIIGAQTDNGIGMAGVNWAVTVIPAKFLGPTGGTTAGAVKALDYLTDLKVRHHLNIVATNNSWTGGGFSQALLDAITRAANEDILFISAAGNGGADGIGDDNDAVVSYPSHYDTTAGAGYDSVIAVAATGRADELPSWSNSGASTVDLGAPGASILSTTPQNTYSFMSGTSMATPHVTGAAALVSAARAITGRQLRAQLLASVDPIAALKGRTVTGGRLNLRAAVAPPPSGSAVDEVVLYAASATRAGSGWTRVSDSSAAGGARLQSADAGAAKRSAPLASPAGYAELRFQAEAGRAYRMWLRGRATNNSWANDSVFVQFSDSVDASGSAAYRIGTTGGLTVNLEDCSGCGLAGWGWQDDGYGAGVLGPLVSFAVGGTHTLRIQAREDGLGIDQVVLSAAKYASVAPGALKNDTTILASSGGSSSTGSRSTTAADAVLYASRATMVAGNWSVVTDASAAGGARMQSADRGAAKVSTALAAPADYFEMTFTASAGTPYHLWIRGKAAGNSWANDSVHVQFDRAVNASGAPVYRIGSTSSAAVNIEDCSGCGLSAWGWQDNGYGANVAGPPIYFSTSGTQRIRIQIREDGLGIDQIVLSPGQYLTSAPGGLENDGTILQTSSAASSPRSAFEAAMILPCRCGGTSS